MNDLTVDTVIRNLWRGDAILATCEMRIGGNSFVSENDFEREVRALESELRTAGKQVFQDDRVLQMRATFRSMPDMDPTRYRPSSEALLRRFAESGFFRINPLVDMNNLLSARLRIPLGIYDLGHLPESSWIYRIGLDGETYQTFSGQSKNASGKLVLADGGGIFGSPVADSGRASIMSEITHFSVVAYLPLNLSVADAEGVAREIEGNFRTHFLLEDTCRQVILVKQ